MAASDYDTVANSKLFVCAAAPATYDVAGFAALVWTEVGLISKLGAVLGRNYNTTSMEFISDALAKEKKSNYKLDPADMECAWNESDAGQIIVAAAALNYTVPSFKVVKQNSTSVRYFPAQVKNFIESMGGAQDAVKGAFTLLRQRHTITDTSASVSVPAPTPATALTMSGPGTGVIAQASANFTVALAPVGGAVTSNVTVTPSDSSGGGAFTPTSRTLTTASPSATFTYTPGSTGAKSIGISNDGGLSNPAAITCTVSGVQATAVTAPTIAGTPMVGTPLSITAGTFSGGNPAPTVTRAIYANGTQVSASSSYTPVSADIGKTFAVTDTATNSAGATANPSANSAACIAALAAATVASQPAIVGTPQVATALVITAGTFSGANPAATLTRVIYAGGTQVSTSATYTPVTADIGKVFTVDDIATNSVGATHSMSGNSAACVAAMAYSTFSVEGNSIQASNAVRVAMTNAKRQLVLIDNPPVNAQTMEYVISVQNNSGRNVPTTGWTGVAPGTRATITGADATAQIYTRVSPNGALPVTAASSSGLVATVTVAGHGIPVGSTAPRTFEGITPAKYNMHNTIVTAVDASTLTYPIVVATTVGTAFGTMFNGAECVNVTTGETS